MPRGPERQWRRQQTPLTHDHIMASVNAGFAEMLYTGCETQERAQEIVRSLYRCAKRLGYSVTAKAEPGANGTFDVRFRTFDKTQARAYMIQRYGPDRQNWPYNPRMRNPRQEQ